MDGFASVLKIKGKAVAFPVLSFYRRVFLLRRVNILRSWRIMNKKYQINVNNKYEYIKTGGSRGKGNETHAPVILY